MANKVLYNGGLPFKLKHGWWGRVIFLKLCIALIKKKTKKTQDKVCLIIIHTC